MSTERNTSKLIKACKNGNASEVRRLLPISRVDDFDCEALKCAAENGHYECVAALLPSLSEQRYERQRYIALLNAVKGGYLNCVAHLTPVTNPKNNNSRALALACEHGHTAIVEFLYKLSDTKTVLEELTYVYPHKIDI